MGAEDKVGAVQLNARLCGVSPPVTRRLVITEQSSLAQLHAALQVAFGWSDEHLYVFQIRGWQFGDPTRAIELALAGGGVDMPLATESGPFRVLGYLKSAVNGCWCIARN